MRAKAEAKIKEKADNKRKSKEAMTKAEAKLSERAREWSDAKSKERPYIARLADENRDKAEFEARERKNTNVVNRAAVEAAVKIRFRDKIQVEERDRVEA